MIVRTDSLDDADCEIAEYAVELIKENLGNEIEILIFHGLWDEAVYLVFNYNDITYSIKIFNQDDLIECGVQEFEYKGITYKDQNLFLLTGQRNSLEAYKSCFKQFFRSLLNNRYHYVKHIITNLIELKEQIDFKDSEETRFLKDAIKYFENE